MRSKTLYSESINIWKGANKRRSLRFSLIDRYTAPPKYRDRTTESLIHQHFSHALTPRNDRLPFDFTAMFAGHGSKTKSGPLLTVTLPPVDDPENEEFWVHIPCTRTVPLRISATTMKQMEVESVKLDHVAVYGKTHMNNLPWFPLTEGVRLEEDNSVVIIEPHRIRTGQTRTGYRFIVITHFLSKTSITLSLQRENHVLFLEYIKQQKKGAAFRGPPDLPVKIQKEWPSNHQAPPPETSEDSMEEPESSRKRPATWAASDDLPINRPGSSSNYQATTFETFEDMSKWLMEEPESPRNRQGSGPASDDVPVERPGSSSNHQAATFPSYQHLWDFLAKED